jgi:DNA-binding CsgD family transcriptional regulator
MELAASTGEQSAMDEALIGMGRVALHHVDLSLARSYFQQALEIDVRSHALGVEMTNTLGWIAMLEVQEASDEGSTEGYRRGALLLGATEARHRAMGAPISPPNSARYTKATRLARAHLQPAVFDAAWSKGYEMSFEQLATSALDQLLPLTGSATSAVTIVADTTGVSSTGLSERESEVLRLVASGLTNKEIGERLVLSHRTVEAHLYSIFNKLNVTTRSAAARYAMEQGLMPGTAGQT